MKSVCAYCSGVTECSCPEGALHHRKAKFACEECLELIGMGVKEGELPTTPKRQEARKRIEAGHVSDALASIAVDDFEGIWREQKEFLKDASKKDLAQEAYFQGLRKGFSVSILAYQDGVLGRMLEDLLTELKKPEPRAGESVSSKKE